MRRDEHRSLKQQAQVLILCQTGYTEWWKLWYSNGQNFGFVGIDQNGIFTPPHEGTYMKAGSPEPFDSRAKPLAG